MPSSSAPSRLPTREVAISVFKARCLALIEEVNQSQTPLRITRRGRAIADLVPPASAPEPEWIGSLRGQIRFLGDVVGPVIDPSEIEALRG